MASIGDGSETRRPGLRNACETCRQRKVKCTGEHPICSRCTERQKVCLYLARVPSTVGPNNPRYTQTANRSQSSSGAGTSPSHELSHKRMEDELSQPANVAVNGVTQFPFSSQLIRPLSAVSELLQTPPPENAHVQADTAIIDLASLPDAVQINELIDNFGTHTNAAFPILHMPTVRRQVSRIVNAEGIEPVQACIVLLTLAISCRTNRSKMQERYDYFNQAKDLLETVYKGPPCLAKLQVRMLHLQYALLSPIHGNIWELSGAALRLAIDLGCHHERGNIHQEELDMRRRLFWSVYCVDRNLSIALGRPPGIPDGWISTQLFSERGDETIDGSKLTAIHHVRIRQLQSEIQETLYSPVQNGLVDTIPPLWFVSVRDRLNLWHQQVPAPLGFCSAPWFDLNYHITLTLLNRPSPRNPEPSKESLRTTRQAASAAMRIYKEMLKTGRVNWNWLAMYQLFHLGIAYLNSLWQAAEKGWTIVPSYVEALLDVQVCTSVMSTLSALTPGLTGLCSAFEALSERIIRELTSKASWATISRAASPEPLLDFNQSMIEPSGYMPAFSREAQTQAFPSEQVNVGNFLADLHFSDGPQSTFDHLFLLPPPDCPVENWSWDL